jgi:hypothetical protein
MSDINKKINTPLNTEERLKLDHLISNLDYKDNTEQIRKVKHSKIIITSVGIIEKLKIQYENIKKNNQNEFNEICKDKCSFLYKMYPNIFNKLVEDNLDLQILSQFLQVLQAIEESKIDQQEGSVVIGKLLKELYIDSALKYTEKLNVKNEVQQPKTINHDISWIEFKKNKDFLMNMKTK